MLIDSHCHLPNNLDLTKDILASAKAEDVEKLITIGTSINESKDAIYLADNFENVFATVGVYPHEERDISIPNLKVQLQEIINTSKKIVGIGECGIDITNWENGRPKEEQVPLFKMQVELALENNLPVVIHNRNGDELVLEILNKYKSPKLRGVAHCFASSWQVAQQFLDLDFYVSFSGLITYPSRKDLIDVVKNVPLDKFLVETDSPYLPPQGHRGEKNHPKYVKMIAQKVAEVKNLSFEEVSRFSSENTCRVFGLETA